MSISIKGVDRTNRSSKESKVQIRLPVRSSIGVSRLPSEHQNCLFSKLLITRWYLRTFYLASRTILL